MGGKKESDPGPTDEESLGQALARAAAPFELYPTPCPSCPADRATCGNCGGSGRLWHSASGVTLSDAGLRRLIARRS